jgi:2-C-methyl-D-erythritol 2,4-cyclodiphosphate synthase
MSGRFRIGHGFDVHRFRAGDGMRLGGQELDSPVVLEGHSDGDVALHALMDALLGAVAAGDIGDLFPSGGPASETWSGADSRDMLERVVAVVAERGFEPVNCDLTIIGQRPRIADRRDAMRETIAGLLGLPISAVSVKATTTDGLGFTGRNEGLAAAAVVMVCSNDE